MAYQLSNENIGVHFNDNTKLICEMDSKTYHYYERIGVERIDKRLTFKADKIPPHCEKKVMIHSEFVKHISGDTSAIAD
jgi:hypothetical protein